MSFKKNLMYAGLCLTIFTCAASVQSAMSATGTLAVPVTVLSPDPDIALTGLTWTAGTFLAINSKTTTATAVIAAGSTTTTGIPGTPGNARLVGSDAVGDSLHLAVGAVTPGVASSQMNLKISDNTTGLVTVNLTDGVTGDAPFTVNTWTAGTPTIGAISGFSGTTGLGVITLDATGQMAIDFGATLSTVKDTVPKPYGNAAYTGTVKVTLSY